MDSVALSILFLVKTKIETSPLPPPYACKDVGWLQTVDSLARINVSRILNGVVGNLMNDTQKRRRFVRKEATFVC